VNHLPHGQHISECTVPKSCHPERNLAESEANGQTQSKDLCQLDRTLGVRENFRRVVVRFFDEQEAEHLPGEGRDAAGQSPTRQCGVSKQMETESHRYGTHAPIKQ